MALTEGAAPRTEQRGDRGGVDRRLTPVVARLRWTPVPDPLLKYYPKLGLSPAELIVILQLLQCKQTEEDPQPTLSEIAAHMGVKRDAVKNHIRSLENERKLIRRVERPGRANRYSLQPLFDRLEAVVADEKRRRKNPQQ